MLTAYKTEVQLSPEQQTQVNRTIGVCRFVYNMFIDQNKKNYEDKENSENGGKFISGEEFSKWLNNEFLPNNPDYSWIKEVSSKAVKKSIMNADKAFRNFFQHKAGYPKYKKKKDQDAKMYFVKNDKNTIIECERHKIKIPTLSWVRIKEKGYIPTDRKTHLIKSGTISQKADRYYVSVLVEQAKTNQSEPPASSEGIGVDLGLKEFAVISTGDIKPNINRTKKIKKLEKKLKREQRKLSRKYENYKKAKKGGATRKNINKQVKKVQRIHRTLDNIRQDYRNKVVSELAKTKPAYITIEDLNVRGMMKNKHLSKAIAQQGFTDFRNRLTDKAKQHGIEVRIAGRFYASSKICSNCGAVKEELKLSERTYMCEECGITIDRDVNAAINLKNTTKYAIA